MKKIRVGLIGYGTVGSGVVEVLKKKRKLLRERSGLDIEVSKICDKSPAILKKAKKTKAKLTKSANDILRDRKIDIVIELIGGIKIDNIQDYKSAGVDIISIGALTHSVKALDMALHIVD